MRVERALNGAQAAEHGLGAAGAAARPDESAATEPEDARGGADAVIDGLLRLAREELDVEVTYVDDPIAAAEAGREESVRLLPAQGEHSEAVEVLLPRPEGRSRGSLRFTRPATRPLISAERELLEGIAGLLAGQLRKARYARDGWPGRIERISELLGTGQLPIVYQPIADLRSGEVVGVEALSRFPGSPSRGPAAWFKEAATVGLGVELELLAVRQAVQIVPELQPDVYLSLNLSPAAATSAELENSLAGVPQDRLVLEITEHSAVTDYRRLNEALRRLRSRGARVAIDDAGSGFSSLRHVLRLAPDIIKLDITLTKGIDNDSVLRALGYALSSFASAIDASVVAEGVETEQEVHALRFLQVSYGQGFFLRRPDAPPVPTWLEDGVFA